MWLVRISYGCDAALFAPEAAERQQLRANGSGLPGSSKPAARPLISSQGGGVRRVDTRRVDAPAKLVAPAKS